MDSKLMLWTLVVCALVLIQRTTLASTIPTVTPSTTESIPTTSSTTTTSKPEGRSADIAYEFAHSDGNTGVSSSKVTKEGKKLSASSSAAAPLNSFSLPSSSSATDERTSGHPAYFRPSDSAVYPDRIEPPYASPGGRYSSTDEGWRPSSYWENGNQEPEREDGGSRRTEVRFPDPSEQSDVVGDVKQPTPSFPPVDENEIPQRAPEPSWDHPPMFPAEWPSQNFSPRPQQMDGPMNMGGFGQAEGSYPPFNNQWDQFPGSGNNMPNRQPPPSRENMPPNSHEQPPPDRPIRPAPHLQQNFPMSDGKGEFPPRRSEFNNGPPQQFPHKPPMRPPQRNPHFSGNPNNNNFQFSGNPNNNNNNNNGPPQFNAQRRIPMNHNIQGHNFGNLPMGQPSSMVPNNFPQGMMQNFQGPNGGNFGPQGHPMNFLPAQTNFRPQQNNQQGLLSKLAGFLGRGRSLNLTDSDDENENKENEDQKSEDAEKVTVVIASPGSKLPPPEEQEVVVLVPKPTKPPTKQEDGNQDSKDDDEEDAVVVADPVIERRRRRDVGSQFEARSQRSKAGKREDRPGPFDRFMDNFRRKDERKKGKHMMHGLRPLNQESAMFLNSFGPQQSLMAATPNLAGVSGLPGMGGMSADSSMMSPMALQPGGIQLAGITGFGNPGRPKSGRRNKGKGQSGNIDPAVLQAVMQQQGMGRPMGMMGGGGGGMQSGFGQQAFPSSFGPQSFSSSNLGSMNAFSQPSAMFPQQASFAPQSASFSPQQSFSGFSQGDSSFGGMNSNFFSQGPSSGFNFQHEPQNGLFPVDSTQNDFFNPQ